EKGIEQDEEEEDFAPRKEDGEVDGWNAVAARDQPMKEVYAKIIKDGHRVRRLRSDRGGELMSKELAAWCRARDIQKTTSTPDQHRDNGRAEASIAAVKAAARRLLEVIGWSSSWLPVVARIVAKTKLNLEQTRDKPKFSIGDNVLVPRRAWKRGFAVLQKSDGKIDSLMLPVDNDEAEEAIERRLMILRIIIKQEEEHLLVDEEEVAPAPSRMLKKLYEDEEELQQVRPDQADARRVLHTRSVSPVEVIKDKGAWEE
ncbi:unnamed protein product, partial [Effrenium voratum]